MELVQPGLGIIFWMFLSFGIVFYILKAFAWKPILSSLKDRENSIEEALRSAEKAREEMAGLKAGNEKILQEAMLERDRLVKEARELKEKIVDEAKKAAALEAGKLMEKAHESLAHEKEIMLAELKNKVAEFSVQIAEKILRNELSNDVQQQKLIKKLVDELKLN